MISDIEEVKPEVSTKPDIKQADSETEESESEESEEAPPNFEQKYRSKLPVKSPPVAKEPVDDLLQEMEQL